MLGLLQKLARLGALAPASQAATVSSGWFDVRAQEGDVVFNSEVGAVTAGTCTPSVEHASDGSGTGAAAITPTEGAFTAVTTANDPLGEKRTVPAKATAGFVRLTWTIVTGPAVLGGVISALPKN
jgi:hypothetical protein